jgi:hypothetical protein
MEKRRSLKKYHLISKNTFKIMAALIISKQINYFDKKISMSIFRKCSLLPCNIFSVPWDSINVSVVFLVLETV